MDRGTYPERRLVHSPRKETYRVSDRSRLTPRSRIVTWTRRASPTEHHASPLCHARRRPPTSRATPITTTLELSQRWQTHARPSLTLASSWRTIRQSPAGDHTTLSGDLCLIPNSCNTPCFRIFQYRSLVWHSAGDCPIPGGDRARHRRHDWTGVRRATAPSAAPRRPSEHQRTRTGQTSIASLSVASRAGTGHQPSSPSCARAGRPTLAIYPGLCRTVTSSGVSR